MTSHPKLVYAHRGARVERPENTMLALQRALDVGADWFEIDVHMTRDGVVVVAHDDDGARMCNVPRRIRDCAYSYVKAWDAGWGFVGIDGSRPYAGQGVSIPTLSDVLEAFPHTCMSVDAKQVEPDMCGPLLRLIRAHNAESRVRLASFQQRNHRRFRARGYRGETAVGKAEAIALCTLPVALIAGLGLVRSAAAQIPTHLGGVDFATPKFIAKLHALGLRVDYWTINDESAARALFAAGADGIITDDPGRMVPLVRGLF
jgi:glycerophosphoryl diester phosphodiesterase